MELYENHKKNALIAQKLAVSAAIKSKEKKRDEYNLNPKKCIFCGCELDFYRRKNKFCSSSCAASFNNKQRGPHNEKTKSKISKSLGGIGKPKSTIEKIKRTSRTKYEVNPKKCKICNSKITYENRSRKTCSEECKIIASVKIRPYQNGSRKTIWYFNKNENKEVLLESTWELKLAEFLDENKIVWIRPKHIIWIDRTKKKRYYFPDFYLKDYDLYLDPKNVYCLDRDREKMDIISKKINIIYGNIDNVIHEISSFLNKSII